MCSVPTRSPAPATTTRSPSSLRYLLVLLVGAALAGANAWAGAAFGGLLALTGVLAFRGKPLARSVAGHVLVADTSGRRMWLALIDIVFGVLFFGAAIGVDRDRNDDDATPTPSSPRGEVTVAHGPSCPAGLLPTPITRDTVDDFIVAQGRRPSEVRPGSGSDKVRAYSDTDWTWSFYFDEGVPRTCAPRCVNLGNVPRGELPTLVGNILAKDVTFADRFEEATMQVDVTGGHLVEVDINLYVDDPTVREVVLGRCE